MASISESTCNRDTKFVSLLDSLVNFEWSNHGPYHPQTIEYWKKMDILLEDPTNVIKNSPSITSNMYQKIRMFVYKASNRTCSNEVAIDNTEHCVSGSDV